MTGGTAEKNITGKRSVRDFFSAGTRSLAPSFENHIGASGRVSLAHCLPSNKTEYLFTRGGLVRWVLAAEQSGVDIIG